MIQMQQITGDDNPWRDVATLTVPAGTRRRTVIERAASDPAVTLPPGEQMLLRAIPAEFAEPVPVSMEQPPPQLRIGT